VRKLIQNIVAGSRLTLPITIVYAVCVWLLCGLITQNLWLQFGCFVVTSHLMMVLNNQNALIRIFSRLVSCAFLVLSCTACFLIPSTRESIMQMFVVGAYLLLFLGYQKRDAPGIIYYSFLLFGFASLACPHILYFIPLLWLLMATNLLAMSWRTWTASLLGLLTPYWFILVWVLYQQDFTLITSHFSPLFDFQFPIRYEKLGINVLLTWGLLAICTVTGIIHLIRKNGYDSIRIRLLYGIFIWMDLFAFALMFFQPQHYNMLLRMIIINTSPLIAHFLALTSTKITNVAFYVLTGLTLIITAFNVWSILFPF